VTQCIYAQAAGGAYRRHYSRVSKQASAFRVYSNFRTCFTFALDDRRGHSLKLHKSRFNLDIGKMVFTGR